MSGMSSLEGDFKLYNAFLQLLDTGLGRGTGAVSLSSMEGKAWDLLLSLILIWPNAGKA